MIGASAITALTITSLPASEYVPSCSALSSIYNSCGAATPGFFALTAATQAQCLCYSGSVLVPTRYDQALETCVSYLETANPALLTSYGIAPFYNSYTALGRTWTTPCAEYSAFLSVQSITADTRFSACYSWAIIVASCTASTPGFTSLPLKSQASCACYLPGGTTWAPQMYDGYFSTCLDYYSTYNSPLVSAILAHQPFHTPCAEAGNVRNGVTASEVTTSKSVAIQATPSASQILTTTQARSTVTANQASGLRNCCVWVTLQSLCMIPLALMIGMIVFQ